MWNDYQELLASYHDSARLLHERICALRPFMADADILARVTLLQAECNALSDSIRAIQTRV